MSARKTPARKVKATVRHRYLKADEIVREGDEIFSWMQCRWLNCRITVGIEVSAYMAKQRGYRRILKAKRKTRRHAR